MTCHASARPPCLPMHRLWGALTARIRLPDAAQAYTNVVLTLTDEADRCVLFAPYYFNHLMAHQMTGGGGNVVFGPCAPDNFHPDLDWLEVMEAPWSMPSSLLSPLFCPHTHTHTCSSSSSMKGVLASSRARCLDAEPDVLLDNRPAHLCCCLAGGGERRPATQDGHHCQPEQPHR